MKAYEYIINIKTRGEKVIAQVAKAAGTAKTKLQGAARGAGMLNKKLDGMRLRLPGIKTLLLTAFSIGGIMRVNSAIVDTTAEFDKYRAVLTNTFQSAALGEASMQMISDFAAKTPFQVNALTGAFVKLSNRGLIPTQENMTQYGDIAASMGKSFDQFVEAALDAGTGEFERLKEFGIKAKSFGDQVTFTFKGQTTTVQKSEKAIAGYLQKVGEMKGIKGSMAAISSTLGGLISNLQDKSTQMLYGIGEALRPLYEVVLRKMGMAIDWIASKDFRPLINGIITGFSSAYNVVSAFLGFIYDYKEVFAGFLVGMLTYKLYIMATKIPMGIMIAQQWLLNVAMTAFPVGLVVAGILALIAMMVLAYQKIGWFRGAIDAAWVVLKNFGTGIKDFVITRFKELLSGITGLGGALLKFFKGDWQGAWEAGKKAVSDLVGVDSKTKLIKDMRNVGKGAADAYNKGVAEAEANKNKKFSLFPDKTAAEKLDYGSERDKYLAGQGTGGAGGAGGAGGKQGASSITGGGSKQTNITISIGKLVETLEIKTTNIKEGANQLEQKVQEALLRAVNGINQAQG